MTQNTKYWELYQKGIDHHRAEKMYTGTERSYRFYAGDQWYETKTGGEDLPIFNFIKPTVKYKVSMIAQNSMSIVYSPLANKIAPTVFTALNRFATEQWEQSKMDSLMWKLIRASAIEGDSYLYAFNKPQSSYNAQVRLVHKLVNKTNIHFANEQCPYINEQQYIIIDERIPVSKARKIARENHLKADLIDLITADDNTQTQIKQKEETEISDENGKCTSILYMELVPQGLKILRSTKNVVYEPAFIVQGLDAYPLVGMRWEDMVGSARGLSAVTMLIANQREVNRTAARRAIAVKRYAFPTLVYDGDRISNTNMLSEVGASIAVKNLAQNPISSLITYLSPAPVSSDAANFQNELIAVTRELEGAGNAATGQIDVTKTSGEAIKAARDQAAVPLNEQIAAYRQVVEDLAYLWFKLWVVYSPNGITVASSSLEVNALDNKNEGCLIRPEELNGAEINIRVDVSPIDPFSKISQEIAIERLFTKDAITFDEYVQMLDDASTVPKAKLLKLIEQRKERAKEQISTSPPQMPMGDEAIQSLQKQSENKVKAGGNNEL